LGEKEGPTVVIWESLSAQEKESWLEEASTMHDWVVRCRSKKGAEEIRSFDLSGKEIFSNYDETKSMMLIAFITFNSSLVPLLEGLCSSNQWEFEFSGF